MSDAATSRALRVLSLLQTRRSWTGPQLADRVGTTERTIRRDIERLRGLGYRVTAERGAIGGYRLEAGSDLPPLLFSAEEAVALALGLRAGATDPSIAGIADLSVSVLAKLEQVLPPAVRLRVRALQSAVPPAGPVRAEGSVDPELVALLALACRDGERLRFRYAGAAARRRADPVALVPTGRRWYLLAWDVDREDWRTFRLDRIADAEGARVLVPPREVPGGDAAAFVSARFAASAAEPVRATIRIAAPVDEVLALLGPFTTGLAADGPAHTTWRIADERVEILAGALTWLVWPFEIAEGEELRAFAARFATGLAAARGRPRSTARP